MSVGLLFAAPAYAQDVASCDAALAKDVLTSSSEVKSDYRLAQLLDQSAYDESKRNASGNAVIYGVPMGGSYEEYQASARSQMQAHQESLSKSEARSIAWMGLSGISAGAYKACLDKLGGNDQLLMSGAYATEDFAVVLLRWSKSRFGPKEVQLRWTASNGGDVSQFPTRLAASDRPFRIQVRRPKPGFARTLLTANAFYNGETVDSAEVVVAPYTRIVPARPCPVGTSFTWSDGGNGSEISQAVPSNALNCEMTISARADAQGFESNQGHIQIIVETLSPSGWSQHCASPRVPGSGNINTSLKCSFRVPAGAERIRIKAPNWDATARGISATVSY